MRREHLVTGQYGERTAAVRGKPGEQGAARHHLQKRGRARAPRLSQGLAVRPRGIHVSAVARSPQNVAARVRVLLARAGRPRVTAHSTRRRWALCAGAALAAGLAVAHTVRSMRRTFKIGMAGARTEATDAQEPGPTIASGRPSQVRARASSSLSAQPFSPVGARPVGARGPAALARLPGDVATTSRAVLPASQGGRGRRRWLCGPRAVTAMPGAIDRSHSGHVRPAASELGVGWFSWLGGSRRCGVLGRPWRRCWR